MGIFFITIMFVFIVLLFFNKLQKAQAEQEEVIRAEREAQDSREREERQKEYERHLLLLEVARQAQLIGDRTVLKAIRNDSYDGPLPQKWENGSGYYNSVFPDRLLIMNIAGINYRSGLASCVGDFNGIIMPDPKNDYDPNAIKIKNDDNKFLGFIAENLTDMVRDFIGHPDAENDTKWRHYITGHIDQHEDYNYGTGRYRKYYTGCINITNKQKEL